MMGKRKSKLSGSQLSSVEHEFTHEDVEVLHDLNGKLRYDYKKYLSSGLAIIIILVILVYRNRNDRHIANFISSIAGVKVEDPGGLPDNVRNAINKHLRTIRQEYEQQPQDTEEEEKNNSENIIALEQKCEEQIEELRVMKREGTVMEKDVNAKLKIAELQKRLRILLPMKYGPPPYYVEMKIEFPTTMPDYTTEPHEEVLVIQLGPIEYVPYSVYYFLKVVENFKVSTHRLLMVPRVQ
jgi:hypothetical protein